MPSKTEGTLPKGLALPAATLLLTCQILWPSPLELPDTKPPVPYLNRDGSVPPKDAGRQVYLDPITGDAVVFFNSDQTKPQRIIVELSRHIEPSAKARVSYDVSAQQWQYEYTFMNGASARQSAVSWYLKGPTSEMCSVSVPNHWRYLYPTILRNPDWPRLVVGANGLPGSSNLEVGVPPGKEADGITLKSKFAPGVGELYVQGMSQIAAFPSEPDDVTAKQLIPVVGYPYNYKQTFALIPKVEITGNRQHTAAQYGEELRLCKDNNQCSVEFFDAAAAFLKEAISNSAGKPSTPFMVKSGKLPMEEGLSKTLQLIFTPN